MAHIKITSPSGWDFHIPSASLIKVAADGLRGHDRSAFVKRAAGSEHLFLPFVDSVKFASGEIPVHTIAVGAYERWGFNRNGDGFTKKACIDHCHTFEKFARLYRNHKNKDVAQSYGTVKLARYNPIMDRIELLLGLNGTKEAADRNGGLIADKELARLEKEGELPGSMACRVSHDVCSFCKHAARTREEYCTADMCAAGGCKDNLTRLIKVGDDVHHLGVFNPYPTWFDWSHVHKPAERTAYGARAAYFDKAAEDGGFFGIDGAKAAEDLGIMAPLAVILFQDQVGDWTPYLAEQIKLAHGLERMEANPEFAMPAECNRAFVRAVQPPLDLDALELDSAQPVKMAVSLGALADEKIVLPLRDFAVMTKRAELYEDATSCLKGVYGRMIADGSLERRITHNRYAPSTKLAAYKQRQQAGSLHAGYSLDFPAVRQRCVLSTVRGQTVPMNAKYGFWNEKKAHDSPLVEELARDYAMYKLAALRKIAQFDESFLLTARLAMTQNAVS